MYLIGIVIFIATLVGLAFWSGAPLAYVDFPSLLVILVLSAAVLAASGLMGDFFKSFKLMAQKTNPCSAIELKRMLSAIRLSIWSFLLSGMVGMVIGTVAILSNFGDPAKFGPSAAMALLTLLYSMIFVFIMLPVQARAKAMLATME